VPLSKLSPQVQKALIAGEDKNFYQHHGIDLSGIARAAWNNLTRRRDAGWFDDHPAIRSTGGR
jgi:membrane peptidoglycan carboxypeptidase